MVIKISRDVYDHPSHKLMVSVNPVTDSADIWFDVENPADTDKLREEAREWLTGILNQYGLDFNDAEMTGWKFSQSPNPVHIVPGVVEHFNF